MQPAPKAKACAVTQVVSMLTTAISQASGAAKQSDIAAEIPITHLEMKQVIKEFVVTEEMQKAERLDFLWDLDGSINVQGFVEYLKTLQKDVKKTIPQITQGIHMLESCFSIKGGGGSLLSFVLNLFKSGGLSALMGLPIFAKTKSFQPKCRVALQHAVEYLLLQCHQQMEEKPEYAKAARSLELLDRDLPTVMLAQDNKNKKILHEATTVKAAKRLAKLAPPAQRKIIAEAAMLDLCSLVEGLKGYESLTPHQRFVANALMFGIMSYCNHLGRSFGAYKWLGCGWVCGWLGGALQMKIGTNIKIC